MGGKGERRSKVRVFMRSFTSSFDALKLLPCVCVCVCVRVRVCVCVGAWPSRKKWPDTRSACERVTSREAA